MACERHRGYPLLTCEFSVKELHGGEERPACSSGRIEGQVEANFLLLWSAEQSTRMGLQRVDGQLQMILRCVRAPINHHGCIGYEDDAGLPRIQVPPNASLLDDTAALHQEVDVIAGLHRGTVENGRRPVGHATQRQASRRNCVEAKVDWLPIVHSQLVVRKGRGYVSVGDIGIAGPKLPEARRRCCL
nr:hypothetical protein JVH1_3732 [Rhodococcus sp. JVH1]